MATEQAGEHAEQHIPVNGDFHADLDIEKAKTLLKIEHKNRVNRPLVTQDHVGRTAFSAVLHHVQYGTYNGLPACLVALDFSFRFRSKSNARYTYAAVELIFEKAADTANPRTRSKTPLEDPKVSNFAPKQVLGTVDVSEKRRHWEVSVPLMFQTPVGFSAGVTGTGGIEHTVHEENRMEIQGNFYQDDEHDEGANGVTWDLQENRAQQDGIFRHFRGVVMVHHRPGQPFWLHVNVKPVVKFSLNPQRLFTKSDTLVRLVQRNDDPVLLDGKTPLQGQVDPKGDDFSAPDFPWSLILKGSEEYNVCDA